MATIFKLAKCGADVSVRNIHDETPFGMCLYVFGVVPCVSVPIAIAESPEIRQILVDLQSGVDPDELEGRMKKDDDEAATFNRKTRRLECFTEQLQLHEYYSSFPQNYFLN